MGGGSETAVPGFAAVVLAGGAGRRLGGPDKPRLPIGDRPMLHRVLAALAGARPVVVVGPPDLPLPPGVRQTQERPPGGGPVMAAAAGLDLLDAGTDYVALLAADLPFLTGRSIATLRQSCQDDPAADGAVYCDEDDRPQWLCGVWRAAALRARFDRAAAPGRSLRHVLEDAAIRRHRAAGTPGGPPPYWDCDTDADLRQAREWG